MCRFATTFPKIAPKIDTKVMDEMAISASAGTNLMSLLTVLPSYYKVAAPQKW
jgi:hypothetical protein